MGGGGGGGRESGPPYRLVCEEKYLCCGLSPHKVTYWKRNWARFRCLHGVVVFPLV